MKLRLALTTVVGLLALSGCWLSSSSDTTLTIAIADTPVDGAQSVVITVTGIQLQPVTGPMIEHDYQIPQQIDLLQLQGDDYALLLNSLAVPSGMYSSVKMLVDMSQSSITLSDGSVHPLMLTTSNPDPFKITEDFNVAPGQQEAYIVDFDLRRSVIPSGTDYELAPSMRFLNSVGIGEIHGEISNTFMIGSTAISDPNCQAAAYIYSGAVTPIDINPSSGLQPVQTATVFLGHFSGNYYYSAPYLDPGTYTVALVCAAQDNPATSDSLTFEEPQTAPVTIGFVTEIDFP